MHPELASIFESCDIMCDKPHLNSMANLKAVNTRCKTVEEKACVLSAMADAALQEPDNCQWSRNQLAPKNAKGLIDIWMFKGKLRIHLLNPVLGSYNLDADEQDSIRHTFKDVNSFRDFVGYRKGAMAK